MKSVDAGRPVVETLSDFIKIDTSNPPGNEEKAVRFIEAMLKKEGIEAQIYSPEPLRANLLSRLKGKKPGKPIVLLGHIDVVPARDEGWTVPPFGGVVKDGFVYGRGAIDMKSQVICLLFAFIGLHRQGITPNSDIIFLATGDEETAGKLGVEYVLEKVKELKRASFVLSEGGSISDDEGFLNAQVSVAEKKVCQFMLKARGTGGHGSMPHGDNANDKIIRAAAKVISARLPLRPIGLVRRYLAGTLQGRKIGGMRFSNLKDALADKRFLAYIEGDPHLNAILRDTVTSTMLKSGEKVNVIPTEATAQFDARILPDASHDAFLRRIQKIAGPEVEVLLTGRTDSAASSDDTPYFREIAAVVRSMKGDIPVLPSLTTGATDLRHFRNLGIPAYGFFLITLTKEEQKGMHGLNERISVANLVEGLKGTEEIVNRLAALTPF
jgi:acetylornithine deacetylase/succinyl-diaminopimelate desuccinylase-like protein